MKIAIVDGEIICAECGMYYEALRATGRFQWNRADKTMRGANCLITLDALASCCQLPPNMAAERAKRKRVYHAVQRQKTIEPVKPLACYPVKASLMLHQIRGANMILLQFGAVEPDADTEPAAIRDAGSTGA